MLPTFLIVGAAKCGTTSLAAYLAQHPDVFMTEDKEPDFFVRPLDEGKGLEWYEGLFQRGGNALARGEASPHYTNAPEVPGVPERIASLLPDVKILYLVRNPIDRIKSQFANDIDGSHRHRTIEQAVAGSPSYLDWSRYGYQLGLYLEHFARDQLLVVSAEELRSRRAHTLATICEFIGVDPARLETDRLGYELNTAQDRRVMPASVKALRNALERTGVLSGLPRSFKRRAHRFGPRVLDHELAQMTAVTEQHIVNELAADLDVLREIVGPEFPLWG